MAAKMTIDLGPVGPAGIEASSWDKDGKRYLWICGSDHWRDWLHHVLPGARRREIGAAEAIAERIWHSAAEYVLGGHSLGGAVVCLIADLLAERGAAVKCYTFGGKRSPRQREDVTHYRHRGDVVPFLPPWRPPPAETQLIGDWTLPWLAHGPETYDEVRERHGLR